MPLLQAMIPNLVIQVIAGRGKPEVMYTIHGSMVGSEKVTSVAKMLSISIPFSRYSAVSWPSQKKSIICETMI